MRSGSAARAASILGWVLIALWCVWWARNSIQGSMLFVERSWVTFPAFGIDFLSGLSGPVRAWFSGEDPYSYKDSVYPPIVLRLFAWIAFTPEKSALRIWSLAIVAFSVIGAIAATMTRKELKLRPIPISVAIAAILFSTSVLFALERANFDLLMVPLLIGAVFLARRHTTNGDVGAALLLAVTIWMKLYPALLAVAVLALRRWQLAAWLALSLLLMGLIDLPQLLKFVQNSRALSHNYILAAEFAREINPWNHPLALDWPFLWAGTPLALLPGWIGAALILGPLFSWVSYNVSCCARTDQLALPYLLWTVALGSFVPPVSNDYNLTPLPLAALACVSIRDPLVAWTGIAFLAFWWQPFALPVPARLVLFAKLAGLTAVGLCLVRRAKECQDGNSPDDLRDLGPPQSDVSMSSCFGSK